MRVKGLRPQEGSPAAPNPAGAQAAMVGDSTGPKWLPPSMLIRSNIYKLAILVLAMVIPFGLDGYFVYLANVALVYAVLATGFTMYLGWAGLFAFSNSAFFGLGAYTGGILASRLGVSVEVAVLGSALVGGAVALGFGSMAVRLKRYYLAITTMSFMFVLDYAFRNLDELTAGVRGLVVPSPYFLILGGQKITSPYGQYYVGLVMVLIAYIVAVRIRTSSLGREWQVVRSDEKVAKALGINVYRSRLKAFTISSAIMSAAGGWLAFLLGRIFPESFVGTEQMFEFLIIVIGGLGSIRGAIGGAILLVMMRQYLRGYVGVSEILFGLLLLITVLALQRGVYGTLASRFRALREGYI